MAGKDVSFKVTAKDEATGTLNMVAGSVNSFGKETKEALKPLDNLNKSFSSITKAFSPLTVGITAAVAGLKKLSDAVKVCTEEWAKDELAMKRIDFAGTINRQLAGTTSELKNLANSIEEMTNGWVGAGDVMESMTSMLYDKTTPQIKEIVLAATDLSAAMGTDLNSAVTQLNNTFAGTLGTLGKMFPELKTLTKEQLEAGDAIQIVADKVKGASTAFTDSTEGIIRAAEESKNALKSAFGESWNDFWAPMTKYFTELRRQMTETITHRNNLNKMASGGLDSSTAYKELVYYINLAKKWRETFGDPYAKEFVAGGRATLSRGANSAYALDGMSYNTIYAGLQAATDAYKEAVDKDIKSRNSTIPTYEELIEQLGLNTAAAQEQTAAAQEQTAAIVDNNGLALNAPKYLGVNVNEVVAGLASSLGLPSLGTGEITQTTGKTSAMSAFDYDNGTGGLPVDTRSNVQIAFDTAVENLGGFSDQLLAGIMQFSSLSAIMNYGSTIIMAALATLEPVVNSVLSPIVGMLSILGQTIGQILMPVIESLTPIIEKLSEAFVWLYNNVLLKIGNVLIGTFNIIGNVLIGFSNLVIDIQNFFSRLTGKEQIEKYAYRSLDTGALSEISVGQLATEGTAYMGMMDGGAVASYTAARDVTVNLTYSHSYVNGDAQEIAINLKKELEAVTALGY